MVTAKQKCKEEIKKFTLKRLLKCGRERWENFDRRHSKIDR